MQLPEEKHSWSLDKRDPLYSHLALVTMPRAGFEVKHPDFEVRRLGMSQEVYVYKEQESHAFLSANSSEADGISRKKNVVMD